MRLIDAEELERLFNEQIKRGATDAFAAFDDALQDTPTVDAEVVVHCKNCKHYGMGVCLKIYLYGNAHPEAWQSRRPEDFCSYGERKDDEHEH